MKKHRIGDRCTIIFEEQNGKHGLLITKRKAKLIGVYARHVLFEYDTGIKESFRANEIIAMMEGKKEITEGKSLIWMA